MLRINTRQFINFIPSCCNTTVKKICLATTLFAGCISVGILLKKYTAAAQKTSPKENQPQQINLSFENGDRYRGEGRDLTPHGIGTMQLANGLVYRGNFLNGQIQGLGEMISSNGTPLYRGEFIDGAANGKGTRFFSDGSHCSGQFLKGHLTLKTEYTDEHGDRYTGNCFNQKNEITGKGQCLYANGDRYIGEFNNSQRHGKGTFILLNRVRYEGRFWKGQKHGAGTLTFPDNSQYDCQHHLDRILKYTKRNPSPP